MPTIVKPTTPGAPEFSPGHLRAARDRAGLTRVALGCRIGRNAATVKRYELGDTLPSAHVLGALAHVLRCPVDAFFAVPEGASSTSDA